MNLRTTLYQFCKANKLEDMSCIIQLALVNYVTSHSSKNQWIYLSPDILNSFMGIGEDKVTKLLEFLATNTDAVKRSYRFFCPEKEYEFCDAKSDEDLEDDEIELVCYACNEIHIISDKKDCLYEIDYEGDRKIIVDELKLTSDDIAKELVVLNVNDEHIEKIANILSSRLQIPQSKKEEAKNAFIKMLSSVKDISGLIAGISEDVATTTKSVRKIVEDAIGISTLKDFLF